MKKIILLGAFFASALTAKSQSVEDFKLQGSQFVNDYKLMESAMEASTPGYTSHVDSWYNQVVDIVNNQSNRDNRSTLEIPVVIHIVWKENAENLAQFYVTEQMRILNEAFQRQNSDTTNLRSMFQPIAGNPNIKFNLVAVERVQTNSTFTFNQFNLYDAVKSNSTGGDDAWNTAGFLNIWVAKLQGDFLLGYAYPPAGAPNWGGGSSATDPNDDGVVVDYRAFGPFGNFGGMSVQGMTTVHEVGHYLGLRHIWGDGDCTADDGFADTPKAVSESPQNCDQTRNTCFEGSGDMPDMIENYMDYSADNCQNSFTKDQSNMMRTVLQNYRGGLLLSAGVDELDESSLSLYPNPTNGVITYTLTEEMNGVSSATIYSVSGVAINKYTINNSTGNIDLSYLDDGVYIFSLHNSGRVINKRIVLKN